MPIANSLNWPDEEPGVGSDPGCREDESEAESETDPSAGGRWGERAGQGDRPGKVGHQQHLQEQEDAGPAQGAVQPASVKAVQVRHRDNKGGHAEDAQYQQLPGPEPIVDRSSHAATGGHTCSSEIISSLRRTELQLLPIFRSAKPRKNVEIPKET